MRGEGKRKDVKVEKGRVGNCRWTVALGDSPLRWRQPAVSLGVSQGSPGLPLVSGLGGAITCLSNHRSSPPGKNLKGFAGQG